MPGSIGIANADTSFFTISSPDMDLNAVVGPSKILSLSVTETMGKMDMATIEFNDDQFAISRVLRFGVRIDVTWGYKAWNERLSAGALGMQTLDTFTQSVVRKGLRCWVTTPSGEGAEGGEAIYRCNAIAYDWRGNDQQKGYSAGYTRGSIVAEVMARLGVLQQSIDFPTAGQTIDDTTTVYQWESDFAFLARLAWEWQCFFRLAYTPQGLVAGVFVGIGKISQPGFLAAISPGGPTAYKLEWKYGARNVRSYKWQSHEGENGTGDGGTIVWQNGQPIVYRYVVQDEKVTAWRLNEDRLKKYLEDRNQESGPAAVAAATADLLSQQTFNAKVKYFFDQVVGNTAPQGYGVTVNVEMPGTPMMHPSMAIVFGAGFPDKVTRNQQLNPFAGGVVPAPSQDVTYFIREHTHRIDSAGYMSSIEIVDAFTAFTEGQART